MSIRIIPDINEIIGAGIEELVAQRPTTLPHINYGKGRYSELFEGWKAQANIVLRRFADEAKSTRTFSEGLPLQQLVRSESDALVITDPTFSIGEVTLTRSTGDMAAGIIRRGHPFFKQQDPNAQPLIITGAQYTASQDVLVSEGDTEVTVPIISDTSGKNGNAPSGNKTSDTTMDVLTIIKPSVPLFDTNFTVSDCRSAGGTNTPASDKVLRRLFTSLYQGKFGPTLGAITAGALSFFGVANLAVVENDTNAKTVVFPTDESWAYSDRLNGFVGQLVNDNSRGFGCSFQMGRTANKFIHITATVRLFDSKYLFDPTLILDAIKASLNFYFNERPDWWNWKLETVKAVITSASRKIYSCTSVAITDAVDSTTVDEPDLLSLDSDNPIIQHYYIPDNALNITFLPPP